MKKTNILQKHNLCQQVTYQKKINVSIEDFFINKNHNIVDENKERKKKT